MNNNVSQKFTSLKWEAKNTYLGMPARRIFGGPGSIHLRPMQSAGLRLSRISSRRSSMA